MLYQSSIAAIALAVALATTSAGAQATDPAKFPDWRGQWVRIGGGGQFDPTKPPGRGQQPPLTPEYQAVWEANIAEAAGGGQFYNPQVHCLPAGMPRMMMAYEPMEVIVTPDITYIPVALNNELRRIYTDGRDEITTIDHALTRPWTITRSYRRDRNPTWVEYACAEDNTYVFIGKETYTVSADGHLMPLRKDQPPPDLRHFNQTRK